MQSTLILVANASAARLYAGDSGHRGLRLEKSYEHSASRQKSSDLVSDRPGHNPGSGNGHGSFVAASDPKQQEAEFFARKLAKELDQARQSNGGCRRIVLVAAPAFLGLLNKQLAPGVQALVSDTVQKDYTQADDKELTAHLTRALFH